MSIDLRRLTPLRAIAVLTLAASGMAACKSSNSGSGAAGGGQGGASGSPQGGQSGGSGGDSLVDLDFRKDDDLKNNFQLEKGSAETSDRGLKVSAGQTALLTYDTRPDDQPTDTFDAFTWSVSFQSESAPDFVLSFGSDSQRRDASQARFSVDKGTDGPPGVADVDSIYLWDHCDVTGSSADAGAPCAKSGVEAYGWTRVRPGPETWTIKLTAVPDADKKQIKARVEYWDKDGIVDGQTYTFARGEPGDSFHPKGELSLEIKARKADVYVSRFRVTAAEPIKEPSFILSDESDATAVHMWVPPGLAKANGILATTPSLTAAAGAQVDLALFEHLRRFATAYGWVLVNGQKGEKGADVVAAFSAGLEKLNNKAPALGLNRAPIFAHSLLSTFPMVLVGDPNLGSRVIGLYADKPVLGGDGNAGKGESYPIPTLQSSSTPAIVSYSNLGTSIAQKNQVELAYDYQRVFIEGKGDAGVEKHLGPWAITSSGPQTHAIVDSYFLYLCFLQELIKLRPNDGGNLPIYDKANGWLGSHEFSYTETQYAPKLTKFDGINEDEEQSFLIGPSSALAYQGFHYYKYVVVKGKVGVTFVPKAVFWTNVPAHGKAGESRVMKLGFDDTLRDKWMKIEFHDTASADPMKPLATVMPGQPAEFEYTNLSLGAHNFVARVTDKDGHLHVTSPVMAIFSQEDTTF